MNTVLKNLYNKIKKSEFRLIAGENGILKPVRWIHMVENKEIASFLMGNEVVFLTGVTLCCAQDLMDLIRLFHDKKVSGVVVNIGPYIKKIDSEVIDFCNSVDLPLFSVPWKVHMADIMREFAIILCKEEEDSEEACTAFKAAIEIPENVDGYSKILSKYSKILSKYEKNSYRVVAVNLNTVRQCDVNEINEVLQVIKSKANDFITGIFANGYLCILFSSVTTSTLGIIRTECLKISDKYNRSSDGVYIGIGDNVLNVNKIYQSYTQAVGSCMIATAQKKEMIFYEEMGLYKLILSVQDEQVLNSFYDKYIRPLKDFDNLKDGMLIDVLTCYMNNNGSIIKVSEQCNLHRNTIIYKLKKVEELLDCDLSQWKTRCILDAALKIDSILDF